MPIPSSPSKGGRRNQGVSPFICMYIYISGNPSFALLVNPHRVMACAGVLGLPSVSRVRWKMSGNMKRSLPLLHLLLEAEQLVLMGCL